MRPSETQASTSFLGRISIRRSHPVPTDTHVTADAHHDQDLDLPDLFQKHVSDRFCDLLAPATPTRKLPDPRPGPPGDAFLSIPWLRKLIDAFLCCEAEFKAVLYSSGRAPSSLSRPPLDRLLPDLLDRGVKALDLFNAAAHGVDAAESWLRLAEVAVAALGRRPLCEGQVRRARKALLALVASVSADDKELRPPGKAAERSWSFGRKCGALAGAGGNWEGMIGLRSNSWSVPTTWSAGRQIQAMSANLAVPKGAGAGDPSGLVLPAHIMSIVLVFVMWVMVAALPCQDRSGLSAHVPLPKNMGWAQPMLGLQDRIAEEWKKKEKRGAAGLMDEVHQLERVSQALIEATLSFEFPADEGRVNDIAGHAAELAQVCRKMQDGLGPLKQQIKEVFHRLVKSRAEVLEVMDQGHKLASS